jgi:hypothetical protein
LGARSNSGSAPSGTRFFNGAVAEVIYFNRKLNSAERTILTSSLSAKYDLEISGTKYARGSFDIGVFGIGRTDGSNVLSTAAIDGLHLAEVSLTLGNDEWLMAGYERTSTTAWVTSDVPSGVSRLDRTWFFDKTGSVDAVVGFNLSEMGAGLPAGSPNTSLYHLLYRPDEVSGFTDLGLTASIADGTISFNIGTGQLSDGYYALGYGTVPEPGALVMSAFGFVGLLAYAWRKRK